MKAWERNLEIIKHAEPVYMEDDNESLWEEQQTGPETAQDALCRVQRHFVNNIMMFMKALWSSNSLANTFRQYVSAFNF